MQVPGLIADIVRLTSDEPGRKQPCSGQFGPQASPGKGRLKILSFRSKKMGLHPRAGLAKQVALWLDEEWTPLEVHTRLGHAAGEAYIQVRSRGSSTNSTYTVLHLRLGTP